MADEEMSFFEKRDERRRLENAYLQQRRDIRSFGRNLRRQLRAGSTSAAEFIARTGFDTTYATGNPNTVTERKRAAQTADDQIQKYGYTRTPTNTDQDAKGAGGDQGFDAENNQQAATNNTRSQLSSSNKVGAQEQAKRDEATRKGYFGEKAKKELEDRERGYDANDLLVEARERLQKGPLSLSELKEFNEKAKKLGGNAGQLFDRLKKQGIEERDAAMDEYISKMDSKTWAVDDPELNQRGYWDVIPMFEDGDAFQAAFQAKGMKEMERRAKAAEQDAIKQRRARIEGGENLSDEAIRGILKRDAEREQRLKEDLEADAMRNEGIREQNKRKTEADMARLDNLFDDSKKTLDKTAQLTKESDKAMADARQLLKDGEKRFASQQASLDARDTTYSQTKEYGTLRVSSIREYEAEGGKLNKSGRAFRSEDGGTPGNFQEAFNPLQSNESIANLIMPDKAILQNMSNADARRTFDSNLRQYVSKFNDIMKEWSDGPTIRSTRDYVYYEDLISKAVNAGVDISHKITNPALRSQFQNMWEISQKNKNGAPAEDSSPKIKPDPFLGDPIASFTN